MYQKLTPKYLKQAAQTTKEILFSQGTIGRSFGVPEDPEALAELEQLPLEAAKDGMSIIAVDKTTDKIAGVSINKFLVPPQPPQKPQN